MRSLVAMAPDAAALRREGLTYQQIAARLDVSVSTARNLLKAKPCAGECGRFVMRRERCVFCTNRALGEERTYWTRKRLIAAIVRFYAEHGRVPGADEWRSARDGYPATTTILKEFGSWRAAMLVAGFRPRRIGQPIGSRGPRAPIAPSVETGATVEEELAYLREQQLRDSRTTQLSYDLSLDAPFGLAMETVGSVKAAVADEWLDDLLEDLDRQQELLQIAADYERRAPRWSVIWCRSGSRVSSDAVRTGASARRTKAGTGAA